MGQSHPLPNDLAKFRIEGTMQVTKSEKSLLWILAAIIFAGGNYFGYRWLSQKQSSLQLAYAQLKADQAEAKVDLLESDLWAQRTAWIRRP